MKISYNWLQEFLPDLQLAPEELAQALTMGLFETQVAHRIAIDPATIVVKIVDLKPHPNADRLRLATIDTGSGQETVVCGAPNIMVGQCVPYSPPGATVRSEDGSDFVLGIATIRGVKSAGMLNSPRELGLGDHHGGIYVLPVDTPIGSSLATHIPDDTVLEVELTPNRAHDCYSHRGLAREIGALLQLEVKEQAITPRSDAILPTWSLHIDDDHDTRAYYGTLLEVDSVTDSPLWLQARLWAVGARPINIVVDITNLVMFELGNPTHAYDASKLPGTTIGVRKANPGEVLTTLDGQSRQLTEKNLVITSEDQPIALAGVMGGQATQVEEGTAQILLEVANFYPHTIYESAAAVDLSSEGAKRWQKDVPVSLAKEASDRALSFFKELAAARVVGQTEPVSAATDPAPITFNPGKPAAVAGIPIELVVVRDALVRQRCVIAEKGDLWDVTPPADRIDLIGEHDLAEDVLRLIGYGEIPAAAPSRDQVGTIPPRVAWREIIRDVLRDNGLTEVQNSSFTDERIPSIDIGVESGMSLEIHNPVAPELRKLRTELLSSVLGSVVANRSELQQTTGAGVHGLFEVGTVFNVGDGGKVAGVVEGQHLVGVLVGNRGTLDEARAMADRVMAAAACDEQAIVQVGVAPLESPIRKKIRLPLAWFSIDMDMLASTAKQEPVYVPELPPHAVTYQPFSIYPAVYRDVSLVIAGDIDASRVQEVILKAGSPLVVSAELFDEYMQEETQTSYAFRITYQARNRTLTGDEVAAVHQTIIGQLEADLQAHIKE